MIKVINKGYTLTVTSWENDGDNYNTLSKTVATKEEAKAWYEMMQLCKSENNQPNGVIKLGNTDEISDKQSKVIIDFIEQNDLIFQREILDEIKEEDNDVAEELEDWFFERAAELLGSSEYYMCRVMESCTVTYLPEDIYLEEIEF